MVHWAASPCCKNFRHVLSLRHHGSPAAQAHPWRHEHASRTHSRSQEARTRGPGRERKIAAVPALVMAPQWSPVRHGPAGGGMWAECTGATFAPAELGA